MPYGITYDLEDIEARRKQRLNERDANLELMRNALKQGEEQATKYGFSAAGFLLLAAIIVFWFVSQNAGLFILIIAAVVHMHWITRWVFQNVRVTQWNSHQSMLMAMELYDDLQELIAEQNQRKGE